MTTMERTDAATKADVAPLLSVEGFSLDIAPAEISISGSLSLLFSLCLDQMFILPGRLLILPKSHISLLLSTFYQLAKHFSFSAFVASGTQSRKSFV